MYPVKKLLPRIMFKALKDNKPLMLVIVSYFLGFGRQNVNGYTGAGR